VGIEAAQSQHGVMVERETLRVERRGYGCRPGQASPANGVPRRPCRRGAPAGRAGAGTQ
jgi:hypothetical protein